MSVELWFAVTPLDTLWSPLPTLTPGLMFAPAFTSVLLMPTLASTPTFGFTLTFELVLSCAYAGLNAASTAAAAALSNSLFRLMHGSPSVDDEAVCRRLRAREPWGNPHAKKACDACLVV
jgi:hypothetical protein